MTRSKLPFRRSSASCSILALATVLAVGASPAAAQSFQGTGIFDSGSGSISTGPNFTDISITSPQAVIDWVPTDNAVGNFGAINFQPSGTTATFNGTSDYAVLNRVNVADPSRMIAMSGTINSVIGGQVTGGSIYFYSPSGFVLTGTSVINVGSLVLSASPINVDGNGNFLNNGTVSFGQAPNADARIVTVSDIAGTSQINATQNGSYVAMVAPRVEHHGEINVNGSAALVGAEAATITFSPDGLFNIQVDVGTTDANGVVVNGDITGPASGGAGDYHRVFAIAVPKNDALTMLISDGADLGFATAAVQDGEAVILSAGNDVFGGGSFGESGASGADAHIQLTNANIGNNLVIASTGDTEILATTSSTLAGNVTTISGGHSWVTAQGAGAALTIGGDLSMTTDLFGGDGESVTASQAAIYVNGGSLTVAGDVNVSALAYGGAGFEAGVPAGSGTGGNILVQAEQNGSLDINGNLFVTSSGHGGSAGVADVDAGNGTGGYVFIGTVNSNASLEVGGVTAVVANGYGGNGDGSQTECFDCNGLGGIGQGGTVQFGVSGLTGSEAYFADFVDLRAEGYGGQSASPGSISAAGIGGIINVFSGGDLYIESDLYASAIGYGGGSYIDGIASGNGSGGSIGIFAQANSSLEIIGSLDADATGRGGFIGSGMDGGDGTGGAVGISASGGNASVEIGQDIRLTADGEAGQGGECISCGAAGGDGTGGTVEVYGAGGTGNTIDFTDNLYLSANGYGGTGVTAAAGSGTGGNASIAAGNGMTMTIAGSTYIDANGYGGYDFGGIQGGVGTGGVAGISTYGDPTASMLLNGDANVSANGYGGNSGDTGGGTGGSGIGGNASVRSPVGTMNVAGNLLVEAVGTGGTAFGGTGGNGVGGHASVGAAGGAIQVLANLSIDGGAIGGDGDTGGNASASVSPPANELLPIAASLFATEGGSVDVDGDTILIATATGGNGANGNGGNAFGGETDVIAYVGDITLGRLFVDADAFGGSGAGGGNGGSGQGGVVDIAFGFGNAPIDGTISATSVQVTASGLGGDGGAGLDAESGGNGGAGGDGLGGQIFLFGSAGGGDLEVGNSIVFAAGIGGSGGAGGAGGTGSGGNGGAGGSAEGGVIQLGTASSQSAPTSGGSASYGTVLADASAFGGAGGDGGTGGGGTGTGGDGGDAIGGRSSFLARGVPVSADTVQLGANAVGGNGGAGSAQGNGGDASSGFLAVESKDRFDIPTERGTLTVNSITGTAVAIGGTGAANGTSTARGGSYFRVLNGDAWIGSVSLVVGGDNYDGGSGPDYVSLIDGTATISGEFSFTTTGELSLYADNGSLSATTFVLNAGDFVTDSRNPAALNRGTIFANSVSITSGGDIVADANFDAFYDVSMVAPGSIDIGDVDSDGFIELNALGGLVRAGDLTAGGVVTVDSAASASLGNVSSQFSSVEISAVDELSFGNVVAGTFVTIDPTDIVGGDITALEGDVTAVGDSIDIGNVSASNNVVLTALAGNLSTGNVAAGGFIDIVAGGGIDTGNLNAETWIDLEAEGAIAFDNVVADELDFDAGGSVIGGNILANSFVGGEAGGAISLGNINIGPAFPEDEDFSVGIVSGTSIDVGNVQAVGNVGFATFGDLTTGDILAGDLVMALVGGDISTGSITTQLEGRVYMADASMYVDAGGLEDEFDPQLVLDSDPVATGGSITIAAPVTTTGWLQAAAGNGLTTGGIHADLIDASAGGTATINGFWNADDVNLASNDIDITGTGGITASDVSLVSTNAARTVIGDGVAGEDGYRLSDAEYDRIDATGEIEVGADSSRGAAPTMIIGDLSVDSTDGVTEYEFATFDGESEVSGIGSIRIVGDVAFTGMSGFNFVSFTTGTFELDAATGLLSLEGAPGELAGELSLEASHIHIAEGSILDQLTENPQFAGYQEALEAPASVQRPDGVIRAAEIYIEFADADLNTLYVQNMGTVDTPAGFLVSDSVLFGEDGDSTPPPGSIDLVINGQIQTESGILTGVEVRDALVAAEEDLTPFTAESTINGCLLAGPCKEIIVDGGDNPYLPLPDALELEGSDGNQINTPPALIDTEPLSRATDVDDPVSGSGNPALLGGGTECDTENVTQCSTGKGGGQ